MKNIAIFILLYITSVTIYADDLCHSFISSDKKFSIYLKDNFFKLTLLSIDNKEPETDNVTIDVIMSSDDVYYKDDLIIIKKTNKTFFFKRYNSDIIVAKSGLLKYIKKGEKFYCSRYSLPDGSFLTGNSWKNNKKDGEWTYVNPIKSQVYVYKYKNGKIIRKRKQVLNKSR